MSRIFSSLYLSLGLFVIAFATITTPLIFKLATEVVEREFTRDIQGWLHTIDALADHYSVAQWQSLSSRITSSSSLPCEYYSAEALEALYPQAFPDIRTSKLHFINLQEYEFLYLLKDDHGALHIGPFSRVNGGVNDIESYLDYLFFALLGVILFAWSVRLRSKLHRLEKAAIMFGNGSLEARVSEKSHHRIGQLNTHFNQMATKIATLVNGNRELTNAVSHELRTPIARLKCEIELAAESTEDDVRNRLIRSMKEDVEELELLVDEILQFSRLAGASSVQLKTERLAFLLRPLLSVWREELDIEMELDCPSDICANYNARYLSMALNNLVRNAAIHGATKVSLLVEQGATFELVRIHTDDDGPGIPLEEREQVFEPFHRLPTSPTGAVEGWGLGLAISMRIARQHGGDIRVATSPLGGARFTMTLTAA